MKYKHAKKITGNQPSWALKNMIKALSLHAWLNTPKENERLQAAKLILKVDNNELENVRGPMGLTLERDKYIKATLTDVL